MTIGTLVVIVLAVIVLVVLIMGFSIGWKSLWAKINPFIGGTSGGGSNVDSVKRACDILCNAAKAGPFTQNEYCTNKQTITLGNGEKKTGTCKELEGAGIGLKACGIAC